MKKKKQRRKEAKAHLRHHQAINEYIEADTPTDAHMMPMAQPWHQPVPWCWCRPINHDQHPLTGKIIWFHPAVIH